MDELLAELTPAQRTAVTHKEGPLLVLAAAGSGKTRVITRRVAYLVSQGVPPGRILAITFTNKAANEMAGRIAALVPLGKITIGTFHSVCARLLRVYATRLGFQPNYTIYDQDDRLKAIRETMRQLGYDGSAVTPERVENLISLAKNKLWTPDALARSLGADLAGGVAARVFAAYQERLRASSALDFDDLLLYMVILLREHPDIRAALDERFEYILVDEYQDTNLAQYAIVRGLSQNLPNLCVTGDPDQSIYGWRGANLGNILDFEKDYPGCRVVKLEQNYRSTKNILRAADHLIRFNKWRKAKELSTENAEGPPVRLTIYGTESDEAEGITARIRELVQNEGRAYRDFAVFVRTTALSRAIEQAFRAENVPYRVVGGVSFYERQEIKDVLAYVSLIVNPLDDLAFARVVNTPARGIGDVSLKRLRAHAAARGWSLLEAARHARAFEDLGTRASHALERFARMIDGLRAKSAGPAAALLRTVLQETGYAESFKKDSASNSVEADERRANVEELISAAALFDRGAREGEGEGAGVLEFLERTRLESAVDRWDDSAGAVTLMTLHAAKGLEFPVVFIVAIEQGILPHARSNESDAQLEEERRLLFVGMTRAEEELHLSRATVREYRGRQMAVIPSPFLYELPDSIACVDLTEFAYRAPAFTRSEPPRARFTPAPGAARITTGADLFGSPTAGEPDLGAYRPGVTVLHPVYGVGRILKVEGAGPDRKGRVAFSTAGERTFLLAKSQLRVLNGSAGVAPGAPSGLT
jgi:DNA helicase-2/ATP-dependent DNA helicase PcrA